MTLVNLGPEYKATGKGLGVKLPNSPGTAANSNLLLTNLGLGANHPQRKIWLRCFDVVTQWQLSGNTGQSINGRIFYPHNFSQAPLTFQVAFPNQYERDLCTEFVQVHHKSALAREDTGTATMNGVPLDIKLFPFQIPAGKNPDGSKRFIVVHRSIHVEGFVQSSPAGADKVDFAPTMALTCRVSNDFEQQLGQMSHLMNEQLQSRYVQFLTPHGTEGQPVSPPFGKPLAPAELTAVEVRADTVNVASVASAALVDFLS